MFMKKMLLVEGFDARYEDGVELDLNESSAEKGLIRFRGKFQEADAVNKNKRSYPFTVLDENLQRLSEIVKRRGLIGELDHPQDSIIHFKEASHVVTKLWWDGRVMMGEGEILSTAAGRQLKALISDGIRVGISSRGVGNGRTNESGILVIDRGYKLITFDAVADPSTHEAFQERVVSRKHEVAEDNFKNISLNRTDRSALLAAVRGVVRNRTANVKRGI
jgi:hypothetical protein